MQTTLIDPAEFSRLVHLFDILAAVVFAVSGSLVASRKGMDVMGFMWLAVITGVGGGTVRDVILDVPVFWVLNPVHVSACLVTAVVMHFVAPLVESRYRDAPVVRRLRARPGHGGRDGQAPGCRRPALVAIAMGAITGAVGGIIRDTLGHVPSVLLGHEIYVTASVLGACTYAGFNGLGVDTAVGHGRRLPCDVHRSRPRDQVRLVVPVFRGSTTRERWTNERTDVADRERLREHRNQGEAVQRGSAAFQLPDATTLGPVHLQVSDLTRSLE